MGTRGWNLEVRVLLPLLPKPLGFPGKEVQEPDQEKCSASALDVAVLSPLSIYPFPSILINHFALES